MRRVRIEWVNRQGEPLPLDPWPIVFAAAGGLVVAVLLFGVLDVFRWKPKPVAPERVWRQVEKTTANSPIDPLLVYQICHAESSLDAHARSAVARGMMQLTREAWREAKGGFYGGALRWKKNIEVGVRYLEFCRATLPPDRRDDPRYLSAAYRFGPYRLAEKAGVLANLPPVRNEIYRALIHEGRYPLEPPD